MNLRKLKIKSFLAARTQPKNLIRSLHFCEAYCEAHLHKEFQKIQKFIAFTAACPKTQKAILASLVL
jgi:hypothetical protein